MNEELYVIANKLRQQFMWQSVKYSALAYKLSNPPKAEKSEDGVLFF